MKPFATPLRHLLTMAAFLIPPLLHAQSPRMILIEEATNASCPPCAAQNPFFEYYLSLPHNRADIIPVIYRANFPGRDIMNAANPLMHNGRVTYYGVTGVPSALVNGKVPAPSGGSYAGAPSDTVALAREVNKLRGTMSPITIAINETRTGGTVNATVEISSTEALAGKTLQIVAVEGHHYYASAGSNGEKDFRHIARKMLPDHNGTALDLAAGEKKTFTHEFTPDTSWNSDQMYLVAFVVDPVTKEVLQAGTDQATISATSNTPAAIIQQSGEPGIWASALTASSSGEYTVEIEPKFPEGWTSSVTVNDKIVANGGKVTLQNGSAANLNVAITPAASLNGKGLLTVRVKGNLGGEWSQNFTYYASGLQALVIVKDEGNEYIAQYYDEGMSKGDVRYAVVERGDEGLFDFSKHVIVYEVGKWILERPDIENLRGLFDRGGMRMFMIGAEIGYGLADTASSNPEAYDPEFMRNYLHADYVADDVPGSTVRGVAGDIGDGLAFSITNGIQNQDTPDQIAPRDGAVPIYYYGTDESKVAGIRYNDTRTRLIYLGFGVEGMANENWRGDVLKRGVAWLLGSMSAPDAPAASATALLAPQPNPVSGRFELPFRLETSSHVSIDLYDLQGRRIARIADGAYQEGDHTVGYDASALPAGTYFAIMQAGEARSSRTVTIAR